MDVGTDKHAYARTHLKKYSWVKSLRLIVLGGREEVGKGLLGRLSGEVMKRIVFPWF